jgi:hypothetical protein
MKLRSAKGTATRFSSVSFLALLWFVVPPTATERAGRDTNARRSAQERNLRTESRRLPATFLGSLLQRTAPGHRNAVPL